MRINVGTIKWAVGLLFITGIVIATNLIDKRNFNQVGGAIESIYNDRLVAKDLIFDISALIHEKALAQALADSSFYENRNHNVNQKIDYLLSSFSDTRLTPEEKLIFENLKEDVAALEQLEVGSTSSLHQDHFFANKNVVEQLKDIQDKLYALSKIQIEEGKRHMLIGRTAVRSIDFFTQMEIYLLIALGIVIQLVILNGLKFKHKTTDEYTKIT